MATVITSDFGGIGDTIASMLTEPQFQSEHGVGWILADGRNIVGSKYAALTGKATGPDLRGRAARMKDHAAGVNPDGELATGIFQDDAFEGHTHPVNTTGSTTTTGGHEHIIQIAPLDDSNFSASVGQSAAADNENDLRNGSATVGGGAHGHNVTSSGTATSTGGNETRMKVMTVNYFVRIN